jgi:Spy/CpxP family protein refolding chaperone
MVLPLWHKPKPRDGGMTMLRYCLAGLAAVLMVLVVGTGRFTAEDPKGDEGKQHQLHDALAAKLGLVGPQREEIRKIHADFAKEAEPVENQLCTLHHEEFQQMRQVLTDDQQARLPEVLKAMRDKEFQAIGNKLGLSDDQKQRVEKVRDEYAKKFHELMSQKDVGENLHKQFRHLRHQFLAAIVPDLTADQRAKLPILMHQEFRYWHNPEVQREHFKAVADKLGVSAEQKEKLQKICAEYDPKVEKLEGQLRKLHEDAHAAFEKVLTPDQRTKLQELKK